jgi:hypothetical protein
LSEGATVAAELPLSIVNRVRTGVVLDFNAFLTFLEHCLDIHGPSASVLISKIDDSMLTIEHQARLLRQPKFDWTFLGAGLGRLIGNLGSTSARQAGELAEKIAAEESLRRDIAGLTRVIVEQRTEMSEMRQDIRELRNAIQLQIREAAAESSRTIDEVKQATTQITSVVRNPWIDRGELGDMDHFKGLLEAYPIDKFQWGMAYNTKGPEPVSVSTWNRGIRIMSQTFVPHGDHATYFTFGTVMFTCETDDAESKAGFRQRYVNHVLNVESVGGLVPGWHIWTRYL